MEINLLFVAETMKNKELHLFESVISRGRILNLPQILSKQYKLQIGYRFV